MGFAGAPTASVRSAIGSSSSSPSARGARPPGSTSARTRSWSGSCVAVRRSGFLSTPRSMRPCRRSIGRPDSEMREHQGRLEQLRDAYNDRDPDAWIAVWNPDAEWHPFLTAREEGDPGYHGPNGMRAWFEDIDEMFEESRVELDRYRQIG